MCAPPVRSGTVDTCVEEEWVELPDEFKKFGKYAQLKRWLRGVRKAASKWEEIDCAKRLVNDGVQCGRTAPTKFYRPQTHVRVVVHGGDFTPPRSQN